MAKDGDGKERDQIVNHIESGNERNACQDVDGGRDEVASRGREVREEDAPAGGIANSGDLLDGRLDDVQDQEANEERVEGRTEEGLALLRTRGRRSVHTFAKVPAETAHGKHELDGILEPQRKESCALAFSGRYIPRSIRLVALGRDGWCRHGARNVFTLLVATCPGQSQVDPLADEDKGEKGSTPVVYITSWVDPNVAE